VPVELVGRHTAMLGCASSRNRKVEVGCVAFANAPYWQAGCGSASACWNRRAETHREMPADRSSPACRIFRSDLLANSLAGTLGNAFSCGTCRTEKLAVIQAYKGPIAFVSTAMQRVLKASLGTGLRPCTFPILFRGQFALNPPVLVVMMVLTHLTLTGNRVALALYAIQLNATAFEVGLRSAEESGCRRFVKLRNEGKNESDTESKV